MAMDFGFTMWNRCWVSGLSVYSPLFCFGTFKNSPGFVQIGPKFSICCVHELCGNVFSSSKLNLMLLIK